MWNILRRWLVGDMGIPGEYQYQAMHLYTVMAVLLVCVLAVVCCRSRGITPAAKQKLLRGVAIFQLAFELAWRLIYWLIKGDTLLCWWPAYPCNLAGILLPIIALAQWKTGKKMFYLFGFVGGVLTFALPEGIFCNDVMVFPILKSVLQHTGILLIPIMEYALNSYRPTLRHMPWVVAGLLVHLANSEGITRLLGLTEDYMFFRSGMPFVIPGVPQFITLSVFALCVLVVLCIASDPKGSIQFLKSIKKK